MSNVVEGNSGQVIIDDKDTVTVNKTVNITKNSCTHENSADNALIGSEIIALNMQIEDIRNGVSKILKSVSRQSTSLKTISKKIDSLLELSTTNNNVKEGIK